MNICLKFNQTDRGDITDKEFKLVKQSVMSWAHQENRQGNLWPLEEASRGPLDQATATYISHSDILVQQSNVQAPSLAYPLHGNARGHLECHVLRRYTEDARGICLSDRFPFGMKC